MLYYLQKKVEIKAKAKEKFAEHTLSRLQPMRYVTQNRVAYLIVSHNP